MKHYIQFGREFVKLGNPNRAQGLGLRPVHNRIVYALSCLLVASGTQAQTSAEQTELERLFSRAVAAEGTNYHPLRQQLLAYGDKAGPLLEQKRSGSQWQDRVVANAMLSWKAEPERNQKLCRDLLMAVGAASGRIRPLEENIQSDVFTYAILRQQAGLTNQFILRGRLHAGPYFGRITPLDMLLKTNEWTLHDPAAVPLLLEVAMKGLPARKDGDPRGRNFEAQCLAVGFIGAHTNRDAVALLSASLAAENRWLRHSAVKGLYIQGGADSIEPLMRALGDKESKVAAEAKCFLIDLLLEPLMRASGDREPTLSAQAKRFLAELKQDDFHPGQVKYRVWWNQNRERLLKK